MLHFLEIQWKCLRSSLHCVSVGQCTLSDHETMFVPYSLHRFEDISFYHWSLCKSSGCILLWPCFEYINKNDHTMCHTAACHHGVQTYAYSLLEMYLGIFCFMSYLFAWLRIMWMYYHWRARWFLFSSRLWTTYWYHPNLNLLSFLRYSSIWLWSDKLEYHGIVRYFRNYVRESYIKAPLCMIILFPLILTH